MGKKFRGIVLPLAGAAALAVAVGTAGAAPAQAAGGYERCPANNYCVFSGLDGGGEMVAVPKTTSDLGALTDRGRSDWNRTAVTAHLYTETDFGGCTPITSAGGKGNFAEKYRDTFASVKLGGPGGPSCGTPPGED